MKKFIIHIIDWISIVATIVTTSIAIWSLIIFFTQVEKGEKDNTNNIIELRSEIDSNAVVLLKGTYAMRMGRPKQPESGTDSIRNNGKSVNRIKYEFNNKVTHLITRWGNFNSLINQDNQKLPSDKIIEKAKLIIGIKTRLDHDAIAVIRLMNSLDSVNIERAQNSNSFSDFSSSDNIYQTCIEYLNSNNTEQIAYSLNKLNSVDKKELKKIMSSIDDMKDNVKMYRFYNLLLSECVRYQNYWDKKK